jgi:regulatory protein
VAEQEALRLLGRRPLSEAELREALLARGLPGDEVEGALARLREAGYVDDRALALDFVLTRSARLGHGPRRLLADLTRRGVPEELARSAWEQARVRGEVEPEALLRRRIARARPGRGSPNDPAARARLYHALLRAGFDDELVQRELGEAGTLADAEDEAAPERDEP